MVYDKLPGEEQNLDYVMPPESAPQGGAESFSMREQQDKFLGGSGEVKPIRKVDRLGILSRLATESMIKIPKVEGIQHLGELNPGQRAVFATSHISDVDVHAIIQALSPYRKVDVASLETNQKDPKQAIFERMVGKNRFHDVKNTFDVKKDMPYTDFDASNYEAMKVAMEKGSDIVIAAHKPVRKTEKAELPDNRGIGAVYLSQLTGEPIIPVAVDVEGGRIGYASNISFSLKETRILRRPNSTIRIGAPMTLDPIPPDQIVDIGMLFSSSTRKELRSNPERFGNTRVAYEKLKQQGEQVMKAIAELLPPEKRGKWGNPPNNNHPKTTT